MSLVLEYLPLIFILIAMGCVAGLLAGLMGIGGGIVLVPGLFYSMSALGYEASGLMHMAVGTSLAIMAPTGISSSLAHFKRGAVDVSLVKNIGPGIFLGVILGTLLAELFSGENLRIFFSFALMGLALLMASDPSRFAFKDSFPGQPFAGILGSVVGTISTLMGIGGAVMNVPLMSLCRVPIHTAVGTAAMLGLFISIPGLIGFIIIGYSAQTPLPLSIGYINLIAFIMITPFTVLCAPLGARLAHNLPTKKLRRVFSILLLLLASRMVWDVVS